MKNLKDFLIEGKTSDKVYVVYFGDGTMYNYYSDKSEANQERDNLNDEVKSNGAYVKEEPLSNIVDNDPS